jgi:hypothetical protein
VISEPCLFSSGIPSLNHALHDKLDVITAIFSSVLIILKYVSRLLFQTIAGQNKTGITRYGDKLGIKALLTTCIIFSTVQL